MANLYDLYEVNHTQNLRLLKNKMIPHPLPQCHMGDCTKTYKLVVRIHTN